MKQKRRRKLFLSVILCIALITGNLSSTLMVYAEETSSTDDLTYANINYMSDSQYEELFGKSITKDEPEQFSEDYAENPLDGYQPNILQELYFGKINTGAENNYNGQFAIMENVTTSSEINMDSMWNSTIGGVQNFTRPADTETHAINTIAVTPGDMSEELAHLNQQVIVEARIMTKESTEGAFGWFYEDDTYVKLQTYTLKDDNTYECVDCLTEYAGDSHWGWDLYDVEQQGMLAMASGDYDGDNYNEVAIYLTSRNDIVVFDLEKQGSGYTLKKIEDIDLTEIDSRFGATDQTDRTVIHLNTTSISGKDELVISASMPYKDGSKWCGNSNVSIWNFEGSEPVKQFSDDLVYTDTDGASKRFKMPASVNADLNGDGTDELVIGGFQNYGYDSDSKGSYSKSEYLMNIILYQDGKYSLAWDTPKEIQVGDGQKLWHNEDEYETESPAAMAAGRYAKINVYDSATTATTSADTIFLEGLFLHFQFGEGDGLTEQMKNGEFIRIGAYDNTIEPKVDSEEKVYFNIGASGTFAADELGQEQLIFTVGRVDNNGYSLSVDIVCAYADESGAVNAIQTDVIHESYVNEHNGYNSGPSLVFTPINVDEDSYYVKYKGRTVGWSNPTVAAVMYSMPYWDEIYYGSDWQSHGGSTFSISKSESSSYATDSSSSLDLGVSISLSTKILKVTGGIGAGVNVMASKAQSFQEDTTVSKSLSFSTPAGTNNLAIVVNPIVVYEYEMIKQGETEPEPLLCTQTLPPEQANITVDEYNAIIEEFNQTAAEEDKLSTVNLDEIYPGATPGDPSSYQSNIEYIYDEVDTIEGSSVTNIRGSENQNPDEGSWRDVTRGDYSISFSIDKTNATSVQNGYSNSLSIAAKENAGFEVGLDAILAVSGQVEFSQTVGMSVGESWTTTSADGMGFSGAVTSIPTSLTAEEAEAYSYGMRLAKWEVAIDGIDKNFEDDTYQDTTIVLAPLVVMAEEVAPPALPDDFHVVATTSSKAVLEWSNPEGDRVADKYKVYYSQDENEGYEVAKNKDGEELVVSSDETECMVEGLASDTTYYFKLQAIRDVDGVTYQSILGESAIGQTKAEESTPIIKVPPTDCYTQVGEKAEFSITAEASSEANTLSYQWQQLVAGVYGNEWVDISGATEAVFNAATADDGKITDSDVENLDGTVYRCIVKEHINGGNGYMKAISKTARLFIGESVQQPLNLELSCTGENVLEQTDTGCTQLAGNLIEAEVVATDSSQKSVSGKEVLLTVWNEETKEVAAYQTATTGENGKAIFSIDDLNEAGEFSVMATTRADELYTFGVSNAVQLTLYGEAYKVNYELNGGINGENSSYYYPDAGVLALQPATRIGYTFTGWYLDKELTLPVENNLLDVSEMSGDLTLYAGWEIIHYNITYELDGGTNHEGNPSTYTVEDYIDLQPASKDGMYFGGWYTNSAFENRITDIPKGSVGDMTLYARLEKPEFEFDDEGRFIIRTYDDLLKMAGLVNYGDSMYREGDYILANDIDCSGQSEWVNAIGININCSFQGTFDGQGYTIYGLGKTDTYSFDYEYGLFGYAKGAKIKNLHLEDVKMNVSGRVSSSTGEARLTAGVVCAYAYGGTEISDCTIDGSVSFGISLFAGGICGQAMDSKIERCINYCTLDLDPDNYAGGIAGYCSNVEIANCANLGDFSSSAKYAAGIAPTGCRIYNCYNVGVIEAGMYNKQINIITLGSAENCYYLDNSGDIAGAGTVKTAEAFASGEVAYLLNKGVTDGWQNWYQNLDNGLEPDNYPVLVDNQQNTVYQKADGSGFTNLNEAPSFEPLEPNAEGIYEISSYDDLVTMAKMVRLYPDKYASATYSQTENINCGMNAWDTEIGTAFSPFEGTYKGNDKYIMALRPTSAVTGLFGVIGEDGLIEGLSVVDFDYEEAGTMAGGLAGINYGTINGCGSGINLTSAAMIFRNGEPVPITTLDSEIVAIDVAGGLVAVNEGIIKNSRNSANVNGAIAGGIAGENKGTITNVYQTGEVSGTTAGGIVGTNTGTIKFGYNSVVVEGDTIGGIAGTSENTDIQGMFYVSDMDRACTNQEDSALGVTQKTTAELKSQSMADELNQQIDGEEGLMSWMYDETKNEGYPMFQSDNVVEQTLQSVEFVNPEDEPADDGQDEAQSGDTESDETDKTQGDKDDVETGDTNTLMPYVGLGLIAALGALLMLRKKRG